MKEKYTVRVPSTFLEKKSEKKKKVIVKKRLKVRLSSAFLKKHVVKKKKKIIVKKKNDVLVPSKDLKKSLMALKKKTKGKKLVLKKKKKIVLIEIKPRKFSFLSGSFRLYPMENQLVQLIEEYEKKGVRCIVQTFFKDYLTNICKLSSRIECHLLAVAHVPSPCCGISLHFGAELLFSLWRRNDLAALKREGISALNIHKAFCTASFVKSAHKVGLKVFIWTVDDIETAKHLIDMNVDGIITNVPALLSSALSAD